MMNTGSAGADSDAIQKLAIAEVLYRYCRSMDRMDWTLARAVFTPDATVDYLDIYQGSGYGFIDFVWEAHAGMQRHSHQISNILCELNGARAVSEAYVTVVLWTLPDANGDATEIVVRGRYLDRWIQGKDGWQICDRIHVVDTHSVQPVSDGGVSTASRRDSEDPSYALFGSI